MPGHHASRTPQSDGRPTPSRALDLFRLIVGVIASRLLILAVFVFKDLEAWFDDRASR